MCLVTIISVFLLVATLSFAEDKAVSFPESGYDMSTMEDDVTRHARTYDNEDQGFTDFGGVNAIDFVGFETGYTPFGVELHENNENTFVSKAVTYNLDASTNNKAETNFISLGLVLSLPMHKVTGSDSWRGFNPFIKAGGHFWDTEYIITDTISPSLPDEDGFSYFFGGGLNLNTFKQFAIRAEYNYFNTDGNIVEDIHFFSSSFIIKF